MDEQEPTGPAPSVDAGAPEDDDERFAVLEVFGLKLEVSNPRLAELLTMDAGVALTSDIKDLTVHEPGVPGRAEVSEAIPDAVVAPVTPKDDADARMRQEFRSRAEALGAALGFVIRADGVWTSPGGSAIVTRMVERPVSLAAATHFIDEVASRREEIAGHEGTALFVVDSQQTADVFKVAIRQRKLYHLMRTISVENLESIAAMSTAGTLDHQSALVLLAPLANIDVGEVLSVIRAATSPEA